MQSALLRILLSSDLNSPGFYVVRSLSSVVPLCLAKLEDRVWFVYAAVFKLNLKMPRDSVFFSN